MAPVMDAAEHARAIVGAADLRARDLVGRRVVVAGRYAGKVALVVRTHERNPVALVRRGVVRRHRELVSLGAAVLVDGVIRADDDARLGCVPALDALDSEDAA